ncbi:hypothetical protein D3C76_1489650 [compost metagenome]
MVGTVRREAGEGLTVESFTTVEVTGSGTAGQAHLAVVHAGLEEGSTRHWRRTIGQETAWLQLTARQRGVAGMRGLGVEGHRRLFDLGALLGEIHRFCAPDLFAHV